ncbi:uncharacterized protein LOC134243588 [Saccostrea cucullata]|uniref:uncharacterized protein LOC134243588 n=1 Tax=Saccostrea cuccullata TaxID=36930 RepID=UPI002ED659E5
MGSGSSTQCRSRRCSQCHRKTEFYCNTCNHDLCLLCKERHVTKSVTKYHEVQFYFTSQCNKNLTAQCKMRQCFQCQGDTEFYCNTCKHSLCLECKERHIINLDTIYHDIVIYREKNKDLTKHETCERHPDRNYGKYCRSCELPVCIQCIEHKKHKLLDIRTAYILNRQKYKENFYNIRSETLYNSSVTLARIKFEIKICHFEIAYLHLKMSRKAQRLIDTMMCHVKTIHKQQKKKLRSYLHYLYNDEVVSKKLRKRPVRYLLFLKKACASKAKNTVIMTPNHLTSPASGDIFKFLSEIQTEERKAKVESLVKMMRTPVLKKTFTMDVRDGYHISCLSSEKFWISDFWKNKAILTNTEGEKLHLQKGILGGYGSHTVNSAGELIYIDESYNIIKLSEDNRSKSNLITKTKSWVPQCVSSSTLNGELLLVGMYNNETFTEGKINRYSATGKFKQTIQYNDEGKTLYSYPRHITENRNGDVIVSDNKSVVVTDREGSHRFSYTGYRKGYPLWPRGICTDALSNILVCNDQTNTVHMIDKKGHFISELLTQQSGAIYQPRSLCYDYKSHLLWIGSFEDNKVNAYRYIERQISESYND